MAVGPHPPPPPPPRWLSQGSWSKRHYHFTTQYLSLPLYYTTSLTTTLLHNISHREAGARGIATVQAPQAVCAYRAGGAASGIHSHQSLFFSFLFLCFFQKKRKLSAHTVLEGQAQAYILISPCPSTHTLYLCVCVCVCVCVCLCLCLCKR